MQKLTEKKLIRLCRQGNRDAQRALYDRYQQHMFRTCYRYLQTQQDAEDALCKGFLKVFQHIDGFRLQQPGGLRKWMTRIMVNEALMLLRQRKFELVSDDEALQLPSRQTTDGDLEAEDIYALIRALPVGYRTVFNLFAIEGYSHKEIAEQLGISENTSKSQLRKARALLQKGLTETGDYHETEYRRTV